MAYFREILNVSRSIVKGMGITLRYLVNPKRIVTVQYPREMVKIPHRHRGTHFLETEKCILCYQCANACPVDCIYIEGSRDGSIDGTYQGKGAVLTRFSIDYGLCIYCNLCCEPCPTECIHMGQQFNLVSTTRADMMNNLLTDQPYSDGDHEYVEGMRPEIVRLAEEKKKEKEAKAKAAAEAKAKAAAAAKAKAEAEAKASADAPAADAAKAEAAKAEAPKAEAPKAEAPKPDPAKADVPKEEAPKADAGKAEAAPAPEAPEAETPAPEAPVAKPEPPRAADPEKPDTEKKAE